MQVAITKPAPEAGLNALREAGISGVPWWDAPELAEQALDEAGLGPADAVAFDALFAAHSDGMRERARRAMDERLAVWRDSGCELNAFYAMDLIEDVARAVDLPAEDIVAIVGEVCPLPKSAQFLAERALHDFRRIPARRQDGLWQQCADLANAGGAPTPSNPAPEAESRVENSDLASEPEVACPTSVDARAEAEARAEERRLAMGLPSGMLRTVDYDPSATHTPPSWLVKGLLPSRGLGMLIGESQAGKSFLAIQAAISVARGVPFHGHKVKPGGVLYIAAEGGSSVLPRIKAADEALGGLLPEGHLVRRGQPQLARAPIKVMTENPNLSRDGDPSALARTIRAVETEFAASGHGLALVIVDTWHAALGGADEQAAADTGHALKPLREVVEALHLFALIVHHPGKDLERGARGSSALRAAVDTELEIRVPGADGQRAKPAFMPRRVTLTKQRDGAVGEEFHYRLNTVELGRDEDGDAWTTCTVLPCEPPALDAAGKPNRKGDVRFQRALEAGLKENGGARAAVRVVRGHYYNAGPAGETEEARRKSFRRALDKACDAGVIEIDSHDEWIWFSNPARDAGQMDTP